MVHRFILSSPILLLLTTRHFTAVFGWLQTNTQSRTSHLSDWRQHRISLDETCTASYADQFDERYQPKYTPGQFATRLSASTSSQDSTDLDGNSLSTMTCSDRTMARFEGRNVLLTGASSGLGRSFALQLAECGVKTLILSARKQTELELVAEECQKVAYASDLQVKIILGDLADKASVANLAKEALNICPAIDVLINNGGVSSRSNFVDTAIEVDEKLMQINFLSGAALAKAVVPGMLEKGQGAIIWIGSVQGLLGIPQRTSYAASKFAVQGYCEALRGELASSGVTVHVASPGYIRTNLSRSAVTGDGKAYGKMDATTEAGAEPDDVAVTILDSVANGKMDFTVASGLSATVAIYLRLLCPPLLRFSLVKRFDKGQKKEKEE